MKTHANYCRDVNRLLEQLTEVIERRTRYGHDTRAWQTNRAKNEERIGRAQKREAELLAKLKRLVSAEEQAEPEVVEKT